MMIIRLMLAVWSQSQGLDKEAWRSLRDETEVPELKQLTEEKAQDKAFDLEGLGFLIDFLEFFFWIAVIAAAMALGYHIYHRLKEMPKTSARLSRNPSVQGVEETPESLDPSELEQWDARRREAEARGDYRAALRWLFLGTLKLLAEQRHVVLKRDKTGEAYLRELRTSTLESGFRQSLRFYERAWFGAMPPDQEQYPRQRAVFEDLIESLRP